VEDREVVFGIARLLPVRPRLIEADRGAVLQQIKSGVFMKRKPFLAGILSLLVPGLGQIYGGEGDKGAAIITAAIVIGNLNIIILPLIAMANPDIPKAAPESRKVWAYWIPRVVHDVVSMWSITFWIWAVCNAISVTRKNSK